MRSISYDQRPIGRLRNARASRGKLPVGDYTQIAHSFSIALFALTPLLLAYTFGDSQAKSLTIIGPLYFTAVMAGIVYSVLKINADMIWTAFTLFPIQSAIFFGIGPLVYTFGEADTLLRLSSNVIYVSKEDVLRACLLSQLGTTFVILGMYLSLKLSKSNSSTDQPVVAPFFAISTVMALFLCVGFILKYGLILPSRWGMIDLLIPGSLNNLTVLVDLGFAILAFLAIRTRQAKWKALFWLLWPIHLVLCLITLAKTAVILAMILPLLGAYIANRNRAILVLGMAGIALTYVNLQPWVQYGRANNYALTGSIDPVSYTQGLEQLSTFVSDANTTSLIDDNTQTQGWWTRLNYSAEQVFVMRLYDDGARSETLQTLWMFFIPRAIWPEKPNMSTGGKQLYALITGNEGTSSTGATIYADMYWHYGWTGIFLISPLIGLLFTRLSKLCLRFVRNRNFIYFPVIGLCLKMFLIGPTGLIASSIIGPIPILLAYLLLIYMGKQVLITNK